MFRKLNSFSVMSFGNTAIIVALSEDGYLFGLNLVEMATKKGIRSENGYDGGGWGDGLGALRLDADFFADAEKHWFHIPGARVGPGALRRKKEEPTVKEGVIVGRNKKDIPKEFLSTSDEPRRTVITPMSSERLTGQSDDEDWGDGELP